MKRTHTHATGLAYLGLLILIGSFFPVPDSWLDSHRLVHALWHIGKFIGAALLIYGLETLRNLARRHRRMTM